MIQLGDFLSVNFDIELFLSKFRIFLSNSRYNIDIFSSFFSKLPMRVGQKKSKSKIFVENSPSFMDYFKKNDDFEKNRIKMLNTNCKFERKTKLILSKKLKI